MGTVKYEASQYFKQGSNTVWITNHREQVWRTEISGQVKQARWNIMGNGRVLYRLFFLFLFAFREREREHSHWVTLQMLNIWVQVRPRLRQQSRIPGGWQELNYLKGCCCLPGPALGGGKAGARSQEPDPDIRLRYLMWDALTDRLNVHP